MERVDQELKEIFELLKKCHSNLNFKDSDSKDHPISRLHESFALCAGAFYHLHQYQKWYGNLNDPNHIATAHKESWKIFNDVDSYDKFITESEPPKDIISSDLHKMSISDAAIRILTAGSLISCIISDIKKNRDLRKYQNQIPFQGYINSKRRDWYRGKLYHDCGFDDSHSKNDDKNEEIYFLILMVALRDEYGHSEYYNNPKSGGHNKKDPRIDDYLKNRHKIVENDDFKKYIVKAEITILKKILDLILKSTILVK
jgi:hypothetical protein